MKLIITESKISNALHKYLNLSYEGFDNCSHNWADFNCGWGVCCDIYAVGFILPKDDYDGLTDMFGDINHWRDSLLSLINKIFNTNARHLMYIYESDM